MKKALEVNVRVFATFVRNDTPDKRVFATFVRNDTPENNPTKSSDKKSKDF